MKTAAFGQLSCAEREPEYPRSQEMAEAARFIGRDGIIVPSARAEWPKIIAFRVAENHRVPRSRRS